MTEIGQQQSQVSKFLERDLSELYVLFGPFGENAYPPYAQEKIRATFGVNGTPERNVQRAEMWQRYDQLLASLMESKAGDVPILDQIREFIKNQSDFARKQLEQTPPGGLGIHLKEVHDFANSFLLTPDGRSRFAGLISDRDANLMGSVVGDIHDLLKFLGSMDAQIIPDHAVMTAELIRRTFVNRKVVFADGNKDTLSLEDVEFIAGVVEDHENIEKEVGRSDFINQKRIERAKALFFVIDVLTGSLRLVANELESNNVQLQIDTEQLWTRFGDLYLRHVDPVEGKIFRPQWGSYALGDLFATFEVLVENGLEIVPPDGREGLTIKKALKDIMLRAISLVLQAHAFHEQYNDFVRDKNIRGLQELSTTLNDPDFVPLKKFRKNLSDAVNTLESNQEINPEEILVKTLNPSEIGDVEAAREKIQDL